MLHCCRDKAPGELACFGCGTEYDRLDWLRDAAFVAGSTARLIHINLSFGSAGFHCHTSMARNHNNNTAAAPSPFATVITAAFLGFLSSVTSMPPVPAVTFSHGPRGRLPPRHC